MAPPRPPKPSVPVIPTPGGVAWLTKGPTGQGGRGPVGGCPTSPRVFQLPHIRPVLPHQPGTSPSTPPLEIHLA